MTEQVVTKSELTQEENEFIDKIFTQAFGNKSTNPSLSNSQSPLSIFSKLMSKEDVEEILTLKRDSMVQTVEQRLLPMMRNIVAESKLPQAEGVIKEERVRLLMKAEEAMITMFENLVEIEKERDPLKSNSISMLFEIMTVIITEFMTRPDIMPDILVGVYEATINKKK